MSEKNSNTPKAAGTEDPAIEELRGNDGFNDMVVREAEAMILHAPLDDLVVFAYGSWEAARAAWAKKQGARFRRPRSSRRAVA